MKSQLVGALSLIAPTILARNAAADTRARAIELTAGSGYTQGFGTLEPGMSVPQIATAGVGVNASVGFRIDPRFAFSFAGEYEELTSERNAAVRAVAWDLALQLHVMPSARVDPWVELGAGYRLLWLDPVNAETTLLHGPQLVRVRAGLDLRISPDVAIAPVIGADATMFAFEDNGAPRAINNPTLSTFVFAGLQGRVDIGGFVVR